MSVFRNKNEKKTFGIIGLGRFGMALALDLANAGEEILALDAKEDKVREIREYTDNAFVVSHLDKATLTDVGIKNCDIVVVCVGDSLDASILTTLNLVSMGIKRVISKASGPEHGEILKKLGAEVIYPEHDMALRLASSLKNPNVIDFVRLSDKFNITKLVTPDCMVGKTLLELNFRSKFSLNVIGIENNGNVTEIISPDYVFKKDDLVYISGSKDGLTKFNNWIERHQ